MLNLLGNARGMLAAELTTADFEGLSKRINLHGIPLRNVRTEDGITFHFRLYRKDYRQLSELCKKGGHSLKVKRLPGLYWTLKSLCSRPVLSAGLLFLLLLFGFLPTRVLFIKVSGNHTVPEARILEAAAASGVRFGVGRRELRSEKIKNMLLRKIPELSWAGINTAGCVAEISVKEQKTDVLPWGSDNVSSVVAGRDGIVVSCTVRQGALQCSPGQAVVKGQVLISGYRDCGLKIQATPSDGDIYALTVRNLNTVTLPQALKRGETQKKFRILSLLVGKKRIKIYGNSRNCQPTCGRMYEEYYITLPGGFQLPLALCVDTCFKSDCSPCTADPGAAAESLSLYAEKMLSRQMAAGRILRKNEEFLEQNGVYSLKGQYLCHEMIGRLRQEKIGVKQDTWKES